MKKQKMEFSKKIYLLNISLVILVIVTSFIIIILSGRLGITDLSPLSVICTASFSELAIHSTMYSAKAKSENILKISRQIKEDELIKIKTASAIMNGSEISVDNILNEYPQG